MFGFSCLSAVEYFNESEGGHTLLEKNAQGEETRSLGFDLQPVAVTDDWDGTRNEPLGNAARAEENASSLVAVDEARGFGLEPVKLGHQLMDSAQYRSSVEESHWDLVSGTVELRGLDLQPALAPQTKDLGLELRLTEEAVSTSVMSAAEGKGVDLKPSSLRGTSPDRTGGRRVFDLQPSQEGHGYSLQPVANLVEALEEGREDDDTPPPESLHSIKNIARARKSAGRERLTKSTEKTAVSKNTTKTTTKEASGNKGASNERTQPKKGRRNVTASMDKSRLYQPSPSSAPSWSPTPTTRHGRGKVSHTKR